VNPTLGGRVLDRAYEAVDAYVAVAEKHGLDPTQMALAWCETRPFMCSVIFGCTTQAQLMTAIGSDESSSATRCWRISTRPTRAHPMPF